MPAHVTVSERNKANAQIKAKFQEQEKAGDLPRPKYEEGQTVYHIRTGQAGLLPGTTPMTKRFGATPSSGPNLQPSLLKKSLVSRLRLPA